MRTLLLTLLLVLISIPVFSQLETFYDDFEDGSLDTLWNDSLFTLWAAGHPRTFGLSESGGFLNIAYERSAESDQWDNFNFTPPEEIDVSENPIISLKIKSDVATTFTVKPMYTNETSDWLSRDIPADNVWHIYSFELTEANYAGSLLNKVYLYLDGGSTDFKSGLVLFDDFQIAGFNITILELEATVVDSSKIDLHWQTSDQENTDHFNIYRSTAEGFSLNEESKIGESSDTLFHDLGLTNNTTYYYQLSATDKEGREHAPSAVSTRTSSPGSAPRPVVISENANPVLRYEKYELILELPDASYTNPYNPDEIDLHAWFFSPEGDSVKMNGFYDNYLGADEWKIRFASNQTGTWTYLIYARDMDGTGLSEPGSFEVSASNKKGWLHISPDNPNYLMHDDASSFYGVAVYYPWSVGSRGLDGFADLGGNFFGYWDCTFDGSGNGGGRYLLESMESGIGKYDQRKAARIDQVLGWAEERDMKVMLAMWAHPYLRTEGVPWDGGRWYADNPYSEIVDVDDFYTDSLSRAFQEKHYRYMIARWGYSQALGIWELINEIHGTTGWVRNQSKAKNWVEWVNAYFHDNDPFHRPTTASFGGGSGASHYTTTDKLGDMPNVHFYELHGWPNRFPDNVVRSGLANVVSESLKLKSKGDRPAFFGEAGYTTMLAATETEEYTWEMHNAFWAGLTNGLASTPFWWEFNSRNIITIERFQLYPPLKRFVSDIDFAHQVYTPGRVSAENIDGYFLGAQSSGFGWMKSYDASQLSDVHTYISDTKLKNGNYSLEWYDTWAGKTTGENKAVCVSGVSWGVLAPDFDQEDVAFKMKRMPDGSAATMVNLYLVKKDTLLPPEMPGLPGIDSTIFIIACYVTDDSSMMDVAWEGPVQISIEGEGQADPFTLELTEGGLLFSFDRYGTSGVTITATIEDLGSAELHIESLTGLEEHTGQTGKKGFSLQENYPNPFKQSTTIEFSLAGNTHIRLAVYNAQGQLVEILVDEEKAPGSHRVFWDASGQVPGTYFYRMQSQKNVETKYCIILE